MSNTLVDIKKNKKFELPVAEEMQMGMTIGMLLAGQIPISIFPRWNFLLLAINQLVNHLDKLQLMNGRLYINQKQLSELALVLKRPLHPQFQHVGDYSKSIKAMCPRIHIVKLQNPKIFLKNTKKL